MTTIRLSELKPVSDPIRPGRTNLRERLAEWKTRSRDLLRTAVLWTKEHKNWFWLALAAILGLLYLYALFASSSPRWH